MLGTDKYFLSSQDADSEGKEGLYFTFTQDEFEDIINDESLNFNEEDLNLIRKWFQCQKKEISNLD